MRLNALAGLLSLPLFMGCHPSNFKGAITSKSPPPQAPIAAPVEPKPLAAPPTSVTSIIDSLPTVEPKVVPPSTAIEFGADEIFRIGDGFASTTSACVGQVNTYKLSGTTYYFQFEVLEDDTDIDLTIGRICGVDQLDKDTFSLINETTRKVELAEKALPKLTDIEQVRPWLPYPKFKLNKGIYSVVITSKNIYGHAKVPGVPIDSNKDEYDDFLVGKILLKATRAVKSLKIYAE